MVLNARWAYLKEGMQKLVESTFREGSLFIFTRDREVAIKAAIAARPPVQTNRQPTDDTRLFPQDSISTV
jgi:hypothetical protein